MRNILHQDIKKKGDPRADTHLKLKVEYHTGSSWVTPTNKTTLIEKDIPMPTSFTPEVLYKLFTDTIKEVLDEIEGMTFDIQYPAKVGEESS